MRPETGAVSSAAPSRKRPREESAEDRSSFADGARAAALLPQVKRERDTANALTECCVCQEARVSVLLLPILTDITVAPLWPL